MPAIQSFDVQNERIRNGIYLGPIEFFFDGPFLWRENLGMLEFTFTKVSLKLLPLGPWSVDIDDGKWEGVKGAEQAASAGGGSRRRTRRRPSRAPTRSSSSSSRMTGASQREAAVAGLARGPGRATFRRRTRARERRTRARERRTRPATARARMIKESANFHFVVSPPPGEP